MSSESSRSFGSFDMHLVFNAATLEYIWLIAAVWMGIAFLGSLIAIHLRIPAALVEIVLGMFAAEIDPEVTRTQWRSAYIARWSTDASKIAGVAMSTTSVAVVYAAMIRRGRVGRTRRNRSELKGVTRWGWLREAA